MAKQVSKPAQPAVQAPAKPVALRGGLSVATVQVKAGAVYRTKAVHNIAWWASITKAATSAPVAVSALVQPAPAGPGVPAHFIGYAIRRGYLVGA